MKQHKIDEIVFSPWVALIVILAWMVGMGFGMTIGGNFASMPNGYMMDGNGHRIPCTEYWDRTKWGIK